MEIGDPGLTREEMRSHMALWCIIASPLLTGNILQAMDNMTRAVLTTPGLLAVNQDKLGRQGVPIGVVPPGTHPHVKGLRGQVLGARCNSSDPAQKWDIQVANQTISNSALGGCLTPHGCSEHNGTSLVMFDCVGKPCQNFRLEQGQLSVHGSRYCVSAGDTFNAPPYMKLCPSKATASTSWSMSTSGNLKAIVSRGEYCLTAKKAQLVTEATQQPHPHQSLTTAGAVWAKPLYDGSWAVALLNLNETVSDVWLDFSDLNLTAGVQCTVTDLWTGRSIGIFKDSFVAKGVQRHDTHVVKVKPAGS